MDNKQDLIAGLSMFVKARNIDNLTIAKVIDVQDDVCTVLIDELEMSAQLQSVLNDSSKFVVVPKVGSYVLAGIAASRWYVLSVSEIEKVVCKIDTTEIAFSSESISIKKGNETLKGLLNSLVTEIQTSFAQINAAIGVPANTPNYANIITKINGLFGV